MKAEGACKLQKLQISPWRSLSPSTDDLENLDPTVAALMPKVRQDQQHLFIQNSLKTESPVLPSPSPCSKVELQHELQVTTSFCTHFFQSFVTSPGQKKELVSSSISLGKTVYSRHVNNLVVLNIKFTCIFFYTL